MDAEQSSPTHTKKDNYNDNWRQHQRTTMFIIRAATVLKARLQFSQRIRTDMLGFCRRTGLTGEGVTHLMEFLNGLVVFDSPFFVNYCNTFYLT